MLAKQRFVSLCNCWIISCSLLSCWDNTQIFPDIANAVITLQSRYSNTQTHISPVFYGFCSEHTKAKVGIEQVKHNFKSQNINQVKIIRNYLCRRPSATAVLLLYVLLKGNTKVLRSYFPSSFIEHKPNQDDLI